MLINFLNQTCNIKNKIINIVGGEEQIIFVPVYTSIPCYYYKQSQTLNETSNALNTDLSSYKVILEPTRTNVREKMIIEITDPDLGNIGQFLIEGIKINRLINGNKDSIELTIKKFN